MRQLILKSFQVAAGLLLIPAAFSQPASSASPPPQSPATLNSTQASYLFGLIFGTQLKGAGVGSELSTDNLSQGVKDALHGKQPTPLEQQQLQAYMAGITQAAVAKNVAAAASFLDKNRNEKGVTQTASGLQYKVINPGRKEAPPITLFDQVSVQYRGKLLDGTEFDSSYSRGVPATFPVNGVIKGWQEALQLMKPGAHWQVWVPPGLAYGDQPRPGIPGGSLLVFDVELMSSQAPAAAPPAPMPKSPPGTPKP